VLTWTTTGLATGFWNTQVMALSTAGRSPVDFLLYLQNPVSCVRRGGVCGAQWLTVRWQTLQDRLHQRQCGLHDGWRLHQL
jgi:hypothetical protein